MVAIGTGSPLNPVDNLNQLVDVTREAARTPQEKLLETGVHISSRGVSTPVKPIGGGGKEGISGRLLK